jgi:hypothetical protein
VKKREAIELRKLKPETNSKRLTRVVTGLKTQSTNLLNVFKNVPLDDIGDTEEGKRLRSQLWALKQKLDGLVPWLARIRNDYRRGEHNLRIDRRLKELNVDPEEVLNREPH